MCAPPLWQAICTGGADQELLSVVRQHQRPQGVDEQGASAHPFGLGPLCRPQLDPRRSVTRHHPPQQREEKARKSGGTEGGGLPPWMVATDRNSPSHRLISATTVDFPEPSEPTTPMTAPPERSACAGVPPRSVRHALRHARPLRATVSLGLANRR